MDTSEYLPMFLAECREHLQELNLCVVRLEEAPEDGATIDEIFRGAHSLKGMSGAMGFAHIAELTHQMEDVFELVRQGRVALGREAVDVLLACLDALSGAVDAIDATGEEQLDSAPLVARLRGLVDGGGNPLPAAEETVTADAAGEEPAKPAPRKRASRAKAAAPAAVEEPMPVVVEPEAVEPEVPAVAAVASDAPLHTVTLQLDRDTVMPAVRALQALAAAEALGVVVASTPSGEAVDTFSGAEISVTLRSEANADVVKAAFANVPDIVGVTVVAPAADTPAKAAGSGSSTSGSTGGHGKKGGSSTVRVDSERLDQLMHLMGELVVHRTRVEALVGSAGVPGLAQAMQDLTRSSQALQAMVMQVRMIPVEAVFMRFPRLVRDLSSKLGKQVELVLTGSDTELDRTVVEALGDPIVHLVRNSLDHGLEAPAERAAAGKPETGRLEIEARHAGGNVVIIVRDDGRGIDPARVARKAVERGILAPELEATIDVRGALELLFAPGFSTAENLSDISGRGVGMDAVRTAIRELGGEVVLGSEPGNGTVATIRLPLTLAIVATLLVETGSHPFAIQLDRVERTVRLDEHPVRSVAGKKMLMLRDGVLPLVDLSDALGYGPSGDTPHAVIVRGGDRWLALAVERLVGQRELVTRALPTELSGAPALSGGAVLSNGDIALIVDCDALAGGGAGRGLDVAEAA